MSNTSSGNSSCRPRHPDMRWSNAAVMISSISFCVMCYLVEEFGLPTLSIEHTVALVGQCVSWQKKPSVVIFLAYVVAIDPNILIGSALVILTAASLSYAVAQGRRAARAEKERNDDRRRAAQPSIVIETEPDRLAIPGERWPRLTILAFKPEPGGLASGACLDKPTPSAQIGAGMLTGYGGPKEPHINLLIMNVGQTTAVKLRLPLTFIYTLTRQDLRNAGDPPDYGLHGETKTVTLDLPLIPRLEPRPADGVRVSIWNETGLAVAIESTGEAYDVDPQRGSARVVVASTPAKIMLSAG